MDLFGTTDYQTLFASLTTQIDPEKPVCPIIWVRLACVQHGAQMVSEIVKPPQERPPRLQGPRLALPAKVKKSTKRQSSKNGKGKIAAKEKAK